MSNDVIVIGAGTSGLVTAAILAGQGMNVTILEKNTFLGGRAMEYEYKGHQIGLGSHLVEDPGDSLTAVCQEIGVKLVHSERSDSMPFWDNGRWQHIQDYYGTEGKAGLKRCINALMEMEYSEIDNLDHLSLREWMSRYTDEEGAFLVWEAISVLEQITTKHWEHSASENLYARKLHYSLKRTAGYSFWPMGGWNKVWDEMVAAYSGLGGQIRLGAKVDKVVVENRQVRGVLLKPEKGHSRGEFIPADHVVNSVPVWNLPKMFEPGVLPWDLEARINFLAENKNRACWIGYWIAAKEPVIGMTEREMASFMSTPRCGLPGFTLNFTGYDPSVSPEGEYLTCVGASFDATESYGDRAWLDRKYAELWADIEEMMPAAKNALLWKKPHTVTNYGVICKPGTVGASRPDALVRGLEGLWLTGDTTRARGIGIDKAARSGITTAEAVLGRRLPAYADTVHY
ncbi:FAD-dependent oxidoreductase [Nakamurella sp. YIM 132087]|uniref:FAD-dependent oxidoreductase n=1 Tax=Nakamurella alba TaxID=2665158 RepID=A0A7K1FH25_9ACTN|nr:FAD-dependent oxidoreductase [Nakamurella alba]MTD13425.1 FAD-dependent oxidoreductase [Nakamurella alba]